MKRFFLFVFFSLTLQQMFLGTGYSSAFAQKFAYENGSYWIPDIEVTGNDPSKVTCECCKERFDDEEALDRHLRYNQVCRAYYGLDNNTDDDDENKQDDDDYGFGGNYFCPFCGRLYDRCKCQGVVVNGNSGSSGGTPWYWGIYIEGGSEGISTTQDNNSSSEKLTIQNVLDLLKGKPGKFYGLIKELHDAGKIVYVESLKNARYFQESKTLKIGPNYTLDVVTHELIHYLQDKMGKLDFDNSSSNNEFQTYLLNYIYGWSYGLPAPPMGISNDTEWWNEFQLEIVDFVEMGSTTISKEILDILDGIDYDIRVKNFSNYYKEISKDWELKPISNWNSYDENYNYSWKEFMEEIGFNFK